MFNPVSAFPCDAFMHQIENKINDEEKMENVQSMERLQQSVVTQAPARMVLYAQ